MLNEADSLAPHTSGEVRNKSFSEEGARFVSAELDRSIKVLPIIAVAAAVIAFVVGALNPDLTKSTTANQAFDAVAAHRAGDWQVLNKRKIFLDEDNLLATTPRKTDDSG